MEYSLLLQKAAQFAQEFLEKHDLTRLSFHNEIHLKEVVEASRKMAMHYSLSERDTAIVMLASYFHDLGYCQVGQKDHELRGVKIVEEFLTGEGVDQEMIAVVKECILATKMPQEPKNLLEEIVCDADLFHFGKDWFEYRNKLLQQEAKACGGEFTKEDWRSSTIALMESHRYHTDYAKQNLESKKMENLQMLKEKQRTDVLDKDKKAKRPDRGIETMFRITSTNNQRLSDMADNKSNILITVNSIILSVVIAMLLRKLDNNAHLIFPTVILLSISLATMVLAILATRPTIPKGYFTKEDLEAKKVNLLFFGNFHRMDLESYREGMHEVMEDRDFLYNTLIRDVYSQGVVLGRKFRLLRLAYNVFMFGLVLSVLVFLVVVILNQ
ncbi:Pycsar system effector family protein [Chryseobacterium sp. A321]